MKRYFTTLRRRYALLGLVTLICIFYFYPFSSDSYGHKISSLLGGSNNIIPAEVLLTPPGRSKAELDDLKRKYFGDLDKFEGERACKIPKIYPFDDTAIYLIESQVKRKKLKPPPCIKNHPLFETDLNTTLIRREVESDFWKTVSCCYIPFHTTQPKYSLVYKDPSNCIPLPSTQNSFLIPEEHENINVNCTLIKKPTKVAYRDYFHFFRLNPTAEAKLQEDEDLSRASGSDFLSLVYLGLDSVAMTNFQRLLPKTRNFLLDQMGAVEFIGLNKVGRGTMENLVPTLSGCSFIDGKTVFPDSKSECHLVWDQFYTQKGYRTLLTDEQFWDLIYRYMKRKKDGKHGMTYDNLSYIRGVQSTCPYALGTFGCFEHQFAPNHIKNRILEVATKLEGRLYYHHLWSALTSHDVIGFAKYLDDPLYELMEELTTRKLLNNTVLILSSDHGTVSSEYSRTAEGLIEARVPLLYFVFPPWFKATYTSAMENLRRNAFTLSTPYDVYQTLIDLADLERVSNTALQARLPIEGGNDKGLSLFLPLPLNRTCQSAHVPDEYCICWSWTQMDNPNKDINVIRAVSFTLDKVNRELDKFSKCARLDLESVLDGRRTVDEKGGTLYEVIFQTIPSHGIFGAVLKVDEVTEDNIKFSIVGEVERQNTYGNQSSCLGKKKNEIGWIRSVCFCI